MSLPNPKPEFKPGCYFDCARGIYIGEQVIRFAEAYGFQLSDEDDKNAIPDGEFYSELTDEAEEYMNQMAPDGYSFGSNENGDWGLWEIVEE